MLLASRGAPVGGVVECGELRRSSGVWELCGSSEGVVVCVRVVFCSQVSKSVSVMVVSLRVCNGSPQGVVLSQQENKVKCTSVYKSCRMCCLVPVDGWFT